MQNGTEAQFHCTASKHHVEVVCILESENRPCVFLDFLRGGREDCIEQVSMDFLNDTVVRRTWNIG